jgi:phospholipase D1/2
VQASALFKNRLFRILLGVLAVGAALAIAWRFTPLAEIVTAERVVAWVEAFSGYWWAPFALALAFTPASVIMFPRPLLTLAAVVAFGPWKGFAIAMGGVVVNALVGYYLGRTMDEKTVKRWGGPKFARVGKMLRKEGLVAVATVGLLPVAPFMAEMLAFGAMRLKLRHVIPGVMLAMLPGTLATTVLGSQIRQLLAEDGVLNVWIVLAVVAAMAGLAWYTHRWWQKMEATTA